jgi:hypothetical protein
MSKACCRSRRAVRAALAAVLLGAAIAAVPVPAPAGGDDPPPPGDLLGLYRQPDATGGSADTLAAMETGMLYAVLTGCSAGSGLAAYGFAVEPPSGILLLMGVNCESPCWNTDFLPLGELCCICSQPLPLSETMILGRVGYLAYAPGSGDFHLRPTALMGDVMGYVEGDDPDSIVHAMGWAAGSESAPAFTVLVRQTVAAQSRTWGALKALYRGAGSGAGGD